MAQVQHLEARLAALEARLEKHSGNSSQPPSSDHPHTPKTRASSGPRSEGQAGREQRKRGGQKGHPGTTRELLPEADVQPVVPCLPTPCTYCLTSLPPEAELQAPPPIRE